MKIALSLMNQVWEDKPANRILCDELAEKSLLHSVDLLIFPEMTLTGFTLATKTIAEEIKSSESLGYFTDLAVSKKMGVVAGLVLKEDEIYRNCAVAFNREGDQLACYAKVHLFSFSGEDRFVSGGSSLSVFEYDGLRFGLTICFDLRFPVLWHVLSETCDCIINIANWPSKRVDHWQVLLQARAIENQVFVVGVNRVGIDGNQLEYEDSSIAFAPDGTRVDVQYIDRGLKIIEIEKKSLVRNQEEFPFRNDRKNFLYTKFLNDLQE